MDFSSASQISSAVTPSRAVTMIFVAPIVLFTVLVRRHLLRGVTFGTIKQ